MAKQKVITPSSALQSLLEEYQITPAQLASDAQLSLSSIRALVSGKSKINVQIAFRLAKYFGKPMEFWTDLQLASDVDEVKHNPDFQKILKEIPKAKKKKGRATADESKPKKSKVEEKKAKPRGRPKANKSATPDMTEKSPKTKAFTKKKDIDEDPLKTAPIKTQGIDSPPMARKRGRPRKNSAPPAPASEPVEIIKPKPKTILIKKSKDPLPSSSETQEPQSSESSLFDPIDF
jgi:addiction module HigA family antidote